MGTSDLLRILEDAAGDPVLLALATVDLTYPELPESARDLLRTALEAAAVPHWCDSTILAGLLNIDEERAAEIWGELSRLTVVEPFPARGNSAGNVHSRTRSAIRRRLAAADQDRLRLLSGRAVKLFEADQRTAATVERLYHTLLADPDEAIRELERASSGWMWNVQHEIRFALSAALTELLEEEVLTGRPAIWARVVVAQHRADVEGAAGFAELANELLSEAKAVQDRRLVAETQSLVGDVARERGDPDAAEAAFEQHRSIMAALTAQDPGNRGWQRELAVAYSRIGDLARDRGDLGGAEAAFEQCRSIMAALTVQDPDNSGWQRGLAVAHSKFGDLARDRGDLGGAEAAFEQCRSIMAALTAQDPGNGGWQRDLAVANSKVGDVARDFGDLERAETAFERYRSIMAELTAQDPSNTGWQRGLAIAYSGVGDVAHDRGDLDGAEAAFEQYRSIMAELAAQDPSSTGRQRELAIAYGRVGDVARDRGDLDGAEKAFEQCRSIMAELTAQDPSNTGWQRDLAFAHDRLRAVSRDAGRESEDGW